MQMYLIIFQVDGMFQNTPGYTDCEVKGFSAGSVIVSIEITISYQISTSVGIGVSTL